MEIPQVALRALQLLWIVLITALVGNVIADAFAGNPSSVNFAIFVAALDWVVIIIAVIATFVSALSNPIILMAIDGVALFFNFVAGVLLAAKLGVHSCGNKEYVIGNSLTNGSDNPTKRCHELQAATAFYWFLFATFAASLVLTFLNSRGGGLRRGAPSMSQV